MALAAYIREKRVSGELLDELTALRAEERAAVEHLIELTNPSANRTHCLMC